MVNIKFQYARKMTALSAAVMLAGLAGCASTPDQPEPMPEPESKPMTMAEPQPLEATPVVQLKQGHPQSYTVVKGDTLWDISAKFLNEPWLWPELWQVNPQIENPHLIYPGDVLTLYFIDGKPALRVARPGIPVEMQGKEYRTYKLSPRIRESDLDQAVQTIPLEDIRSFLTSPRIVSDGELERQPYIVAHDEGRLASGSGYTVYARGIKENELADSYDIVRSGEEYVDPDTGEVLGYEAFYLGKAQTRRYGDPTKLYVTESNREILRGDRLLPVEDDKLQFTYMPRAPEGDVHGKIIALHDGVARVGQFQIVVLNLGRQDDIQPGHVLAVMQSGIEVEDIVENENITLPDEKAGTVMVFRAFERVSYALVMRSTRAIRLLDSVITP